MKVRSIKHRRIVSPVIQYSLKSDRARPWSLAQFNWATPNRIAYTPTGPTLRRRAGKPATLFCRRDVTFSGVLRLALR